jgi:hypothetical protein
MVNHLEAKRLAALSDFRVFREFRGRLFCNVLAKETNRFRDAAILS